MQFPALPPLPETILKHVPEHVFQEEVPKKIFSVRFEREEFSEEVLQFFKFEREKEHPTCNWLIPQRVMLSSFPGDLNVGIARTKISAVLSAGINCFVCLQEEHELIGYASYRHLVLEEADKLGIDKTSIVFITFPIPDGFIVQEKLMDKFTDKLIDHHLIEKNRKMLIHCFAGRGRTGTAAAIILGKLYPQLNAHEALLYTQVSHDARRNPKDGYCPQRNSQRYQVISILNQYRQKMMEQSKDAEQP